MILCPRLGCGGILKEDTGFTADMRSYGFSQRRYVCLAGHSWYSERPEPMSPQIRAVARPWSRHRIVVVCAMCQQSFSGITRQKYCSVACRTEHELERLEHRRMVDGPRLTGEALRQAKAIPSFQAQGRIPRPYPREGRRVAAR